MATAKEERQAEREAQNAENQRRQDEFGFAQAKAEAGVADEKDPAGKTRKIHAAAQARDEAGQAQK
jgi:hypothetical protein